MTKVLFICHGNICRSPMAEFVMKDLVDKAGLSDQFEIASAATSTEEIGNPVYPPARRKLAEHGISCCGFTCGRPTPTMAHTIRRLPARSTPSPKMPPITPKPRSVSAGPAQTEPEIQPERHHPDGFPAQGCECPGNVLQNLRVPAADMRSLGKRQSSFPFWPAPAGPVHPKLPARWLRGRGSG